MTDSEKIEKLISEIQYMGGLESRVAEHLIANGVTIPKRGHWIIHSSGRGENATNWAECSECHVCGSPQWKVCPVCETKMESY